jgi:TetR/AcrR family transcriptional regulator, cholesterol catabolism regulator
MAKITKKKEIIEKSAQLFRDKGFAASSVRDIAAAVGLEASSLYSHVKSKEELLYLICMECASHYNNNIDEVLEANIHDDHLRLKSILSIHIDLALNDPTSSTVFSDEWKYLPTDMLENFIQERKNYEKKFVSVLEDLMQKNKIKKADPTIVMNTLISATRWLHYSKKKFSNKEKDDTKEMVLTMLMHGVIA